MNTQKRLMLNYLAQMSGTAALLVGASFVRRHLVARDTPGTGEAFLLPVLALQVALIWVFFLIVYRTYRRLDEMQKLMLLKIISIGAGVALCLASSYMLLRPVLHLRDLSILYAPWLLGGCWTAITLGGLVLAAMRGELHDR